MASLLASIIDRTIIPYLNEFFSDVDRLGANLTHR